MNLYLLSISAIIILSGIVVNYIRYIEKIKNKDEVDSLDEKADEFDITILE